MVAQPPGYNITCDPGDLYNRKCYTNVYSTPGCDPATDPTCTISQQEIIRYTNDGQPISKAPSSASWLAWVPTLTTLDMSGMAIQPYGEAGLPYVSPSGQTNPTGEPDEEESSTSSDTEGRSQEGLESTPTLVQALGITAVVASVGSVLLGKW